MSLHQQLEQHIRCRTGRQVRNLSVELQPEQVVLRGRAGSFYVKQLAQEGVREMLPHVRLENAIEVERNALRLG